jgi:uncharacterized membrane protein YkoI
MNNSLRESMFDQWMGRRVAPTVAVAGLALLISACNGGQAANDSADAAAPTDAVSSSSVPAVIVPVQEDVVSSEQAQEIALAAIGEGRVTWITPEDDRGAAWEVEVTRPDGSEVDVLVAADGTVVGQVDQVLPEVATEGVAVGGSDGANIEGSPAAEVGGSDTAGVTPAPGAGISSQEAEQIALAAIGEGRVTWITPEDDQGAAWEVEVTRPDGSEVDVLVAADGTVVGQIERVLPQTGGSQGGVTGGSDGANAGGSGGADVGGSDGVQVAPAPGTVVSAEEAAAAALAAIGEGTVTWIGPEDDRGAAWEVEITLPNGREIDVLVRADGTVIG